jgi:iron complex outermembrane receptor protein
VKNQFSQKGKVLVCILHRPRYSALIVLICLLIAFFGAPKARAQIKQLNMWLDDLTSLQNSSDADLREQFDAVASIFSGIELWLKLHPKSGIEMPVAPQQPWSIDQTRSLVARLRRVVENILKQNPGQPFELGATEVIVTAEASPLSPVANSIDHTEIRNLYAEKVTQSIQYLPGTTVDHNSPRGQSGIMIRGFDTRQVGLYLDGIPIYVPYDGFADVNRFLTSDLGEIEVAKGYSSPLLGPNGLGGAVNLITRQPEKKLEADAALGTGSGNKLESWLHLGSRWQPFIVWGGVDWLQTDFFPISGKFALNSLQPDYHRVNSYQRDARYSGRFGWMPKPQDQYVFTYTTQRADYGVPPYGGKDPENNKPKYWQWPYWNKDSYYFNSHTGLGETSALKLRAFYDRYRNSMNGFTDGTYKSLASASPYDDYSAGASTVFTTRVLPRHAISTSFFFKDDTHKESGITYKNDSILTQPQRRHRDQLISIGIQDVLLISSRIRATVGFSADLLNPKKAQDLETIVVGSGKNATTTYSIAPFQCSGSSASASFSSCLNHVWDYNPLASISYSLATTGTLFFAVAQKSHFPTLKDRYSYKNGRAIPNPALQPEHARNWSLGYSHVFTRNTIMRVDLFRSDVYDAIQNAIIPEQSENQCPSLAGGMCQQAVNVGKEAHQGAEIAVRSTPLSRLTLDMNYSYLHWTISGPPNMLGIQPTRAPKHKFIGIASMHLPHEALLLATVRYESGTITTNDVGSVVPASKFATADLELTVPIYAGMRLQTGVRNLFDRDYYFQEGFPQPGRTWHINMRYRF